MTKTLLDHIQEHIRDLPFYIAGKSLRQAGSKPAIITLASNENPFGPSPLAAEAIRSASSGVNLYPDNDIADLRNALAVRHSLAPEQIFLADGSLGVLDIMARTMMGPGLNCVSSEKSFISYPIVTKAAGAHFIAARMRNNTYDLDALMKAINGQTRVVIIANPNNPTGTIVSADEVEQFLLNVPENVLVIIDEAYSDFAEYFATQRGTVYSHALKHVRAGRRNLLVLRTFSKAHGLAGLRVGYACGHPDLLQYFARVQSAFSVSVVAQAAALAAIRDDNHVRRTVENNAREAARMMESFGKLEIVTPPTSGNFFYFETAENADCLARRLDQEGIIVRSLVSWGIPNGVRVTIGLPEQNERFFEALRKSLTQVVAR